jgi:quinol monooxygenase YgiN
MTVTEFAILPLNHPLTKDNSTLPEPLIEKLQTAKKVLESSARYPFHYFQQIEDPSTIYLIGKWGSVAEHEEFLSSAENQALLDLLKNDITMSVDGDRKMTMWHLDTDVFALNISSGEKSVFTAPAISCNRHFVPAEKKEAFVKKFQEIRGLLEAYTKPFKVIGGWRIEKEVVEGKEREEWALFSGFESVDHHFAFAKTEEFTKYKEIISFVDGFEVRHLTSIKGLS